VIQSTSFEDSYTSMCGCVCGCVFVCVCVCACVCVRMHLSAYQLSTSVYLCGHICVCITAVYLSGHICVCMYFSIFERTYMCVHIGMGVHKWV